MFTKAAFRRSLWSSTPRKIASVLLVVVFLGLGMLAGYIYTIKSSVKVLDVNELVPEDQVTIIEPHLGPDPNEEVVPIDPDDPNPGEALNLLIIGSDSRDSDENVDIGGAPTVTGMRSDVTMIAHINSTRTKVKLISIPRDSWVEIPECKRSDGSVSEPYENKFNSAFATGGANGDLASAVACTMTTIQSLTGIKVDGFVVADFAGVAGLVDSLGGIEVDVPRDIESEKAGGLVLKAGKQTLDGRTAVQYSRARSGKGLNGSDLTRISHQHQVMHAIADRLKDKVSNPTSALQVIQNLARMVTVSPSLEPTKSVGLAWALRSAEVESIELPVYDRGDGANLLWDEEEADKIWKSMKVKKSK